MSDLMRILLLTFLVQFLSVVTITLVAVFLVRPEIPVVDDGSKLWVLVNRIRTILNFPRHVAHSVRRVIRPF